MNTSAIRICLATLLLFSLSTPLVKAQSTVDPKSDEGKGTIFQRGAHYFLFRKDETPARTRNPEVIINGAKAPTLKLPWLGISFLCEQNPAMEAKSFVGRLYLTYPNPFTKKEVTLGPYIAQVSKGNENECSADWLVPEAGKLPAGTQTTAVISLLLKTDEDNPRARQISNSLKVPVELAP